MEMAATIEVDLRGYEDVLQRRRARAVALAYARLAQSRKKIIKSGNNDDKGNELSQKKKEDVKKNKTIDALINYTQTDTI